jgi:hypothetical protein
MGKRKSSKSKSKAGDKEKKSGLCSAVKLNSVKMDTPRL